MWYAYAVLVAMLWGLYAVIESRIIKQYHPLFMFILGGLCWGAVSLVMLIYKRDELLPLYKKAAKGKTLAIAIAGSIFAIVGANYLFMLALENAPSPNIVLSLAYSAPIFAILISILLFQYPVNRIEITGMVIAIIGVGLVTSSLK